MSTTTALRRRPRGRRAGRRAAVLVALLAVLAVVSGCVAMPTEGPVVRVDPQASDADDSGAFYDPRPPEPGADPQEVVLGFLEAMKATPVRTSVAAGFLSERAQRMWRPEDATLSYGDVGPPNGSSTVEIQLVDAQSYDRRGTWDRALSAEESTMRFPMTLEGEEWRIDEAPNALLVPEWWFQDWFARASLYFLDPSQQVLVPEPVVVPSGDQMATALVRGLLAGPPREGVSRGALPGDVRLAMNSVPIDEGVADIVLEDLDGRLDEVASEEMVAQLAWTLRQVPQVTHFRVTVDDRPVTMPGGGKEISVMAGLPFSPLGVRPERDLFALVDGRLVRGGFESFNATSGPFGAKAWGLRSVALTLDGSEAVGVVADGTTALRAAVNRGDPPRRVLTGATDLLQPAVDFAGRAWFLDRTGNGAVVRVLGEEGPAQVVDVPGVSGQDVSHFLVSRDASRLVAVVRGAQRDRVVVSRIVHREGRLPKVSRATEVESGTEPANRVTDIGWRSPVTLAVLSNVTPDVAQVQVVPVDGAPGEIESPGTARVRGQATGLVVSPADGDGVYVITRDQVLDLTRPSRDLPAPGEGLAWFGFVG